MCEHLATQSYHLNNIPNGEWFSVLHILTCVSWGEWKGVDKNA